MNAVRLFATGLLVVLSTSALAADSRTELPKLSRDSGALLHSTGTQQALAARETAGPDTFALYGGPDAALEGRFETATGQPDFQGWTTEDVTDIPPAWQVSTYMAENLNGHGPGNHAYWCGLDETQAPSDWATPPGYGNDWIQDLVWESGPVADPQGWETVSLDFFFNTDMEPEYDLLEVAYHFAGNWVTVFEADGENLNLQYSSLDSMTALPIRYEPNSYAGDDHDRIRLRIRVRTDGFGSDQDGEFPSDGAAQIDDIQIGWSGGVEFEDFEGPGPYLFEPIRQPFAGDFASVLSLLTDIDPCRSNITPAAAFIDYGQPPINGPGADGTVSTGGRISLNVEYGIPGHYTVNGAGGLAAPSDFIAVQNYFVSPEIPWDLAGPEDDGADMVGAVLRFDVWDHLPIANFVARVWWVRSRTVGGDWSPWRNWGTVALGGGGSWETITEPIGERLIEDGVPDVIQVRLGVWDMSTVFGYSSIDDATPAPVYDNVAVLKHRVGGPSVVADEWHLANDGFPRAPVFDVSSQAARDQQDIAFDMAWDINSWGPSIVPGDSVVFDVKSLIPGADVQDVRMVWALQLNPFFEDEIRTLPARPQDQNTVAGAQLWTGEVLADQTLLSNGVRVPDRYEADLPDVDFLYPGDVLHYYYQATDSDGRVTTLPNDTSGFLDFSEYSPFNREFMVRGLPSVRDAAGDQPPTLVIYDAERGHESEVILAFRELGEAEGVDFDTYRVTDPAGLLSNGIGSHGGHGASVEQLAGYENILYLSGILDSSLSDGTDDGLNSKADDMSLITDWSILPGTRRIAYFGDSVAGVALSSGVGEFWLASQIGVERVSDDVREFLGGQYAPRVEPGSPSFYTEFVASGGCFSIADFDHIIPTYAGFAPWYFYDQYGVPQWDAPAAVMQERTNGFDVLFPIAFHRIVPVYDQEVQASARAQLLQELFDLYLYCVTNPCTGTTPDLLPVELGVSPNPFNPTTTVKFTAAAGSKGEVKVFNLRGELVRTLHSGEFRSQEFTWDGTDARGASVASGVYMIRATDGTVTRTEKVALVK